MIGATPLTCETFQARAVARPFTLTVPSPNNFAKKPGCGFVTVTWIVSVSKSCWLNVIAVPLAPGAAPLFLPTYSLASDVARVVSGSRLGAGERGRVRRRLGCSVRPVPGADVDD